MGKYSTIFFCLCRKPFFIKVFKELYIIFTHDLCVVISRQKTNKNKLSTNLRLEVGSETEMIPECQRVESFLACDWSIEAFPRLSLVVMTLTTLTWVVKTLTMTGTLCPATVLT